MGWFKRTFSDVDPLSHTPAKKKRAPRRHFAALYPLSGRVVLKQFNNPKRVGTRARDMYDIYSYERCHTVGDCLREGMSYRDIDGDVSHGYIEIVEDE